jgi:hypothetical protein
LSTAIHSGVPSGRPIVGVRSIRAVCRRVGRFAAEGRQNREAAHATALQLPTRHRRPARCARPLDHGEPSTPRTNPETTGFKRDIAGHRREIRFVYHHRAKAALEEMAGPAEPGVNDSGERRCASANAARGPFWAITAITVTVYFLPVGFTTAALAEACAGPFAASDRLCRVRGGGRAGPRAPRSIPVPERSSDRRRPLDASRSRGVAWRGEKGGKVGKQRTQRRHHFQLVILARQVCASARPRPVFGTAHLPRDHRI